MVADRIERALNLRQQPRAVVFHDKGDDRHMHVAWVRFNTAAGQAREQGFFKRKLVAVCREVKQQFRLKYTVEDAAPAQISCRVFNDAEDAAYCDGRKRFDGKEPVSAKPDAAQKSTGSSSEPALNRSRRSVVIHSSFPENGPVMVPVSLSARAARSAGSLRSQRNSQAVRQSRWILGRNPQCLFPIPADNITDMGNYLQTLGPGYTEGFDLRDSVRESCQSPLFTDADCQEALDRMLRKRDDIVSRR